MQLVLVPQYAPVAFVTYPDHVRCSVIVVGEDQPRRREDDAGAASAVPNREIGGHFIAGVLVTVAGLSGHEELSVDDLVTRVVPWLGNAFEIGERVAPRAGHRGYRRECRGGGSRRRHVHTLAGVRCG